MEGDDGVVRVTRFFDLLGQTARLMAGQPSYEAYVAHMQQKHPDHTPMTRVEFFRDREAAQYGEGKGGCFRCC